MLHTSLTYLAVYGKQVSTRGLRRGVTEEATWPNPNDTRLGRAAAGTWWLKLPLPTWKTL